MLGVTGGVSDTGDGCRKNDGGPARQARTTTAQWEHWRTIPNITNTNIILEHHTGTLYIIRSNISPHFSEIVGNKENASHFSNVELFSN